MEDTTFSMLFLYSLAFLFLVITVLSIAVYLAKQTAGKQYGRDHEKTPRQDSDEGFANRDYAAENTHSTVGQIAGKAKVKAAQAGSASD
jgi:uncharacterized MAPEG superfamily protein